MFGGYTTTDALVRNTKVTQLSGSSGIWSDGYCEWYIDNLYALCVTICILACSYASTHLNTIEPFVGANYSF